MASAEERMQILKMIQEGKISAEEGAKLLQALSAGKSDKRSTASSGSGGDARWFRVRVTDLASGKSKVNVNIPMGLVNVAIKMGARFAPNVEGVNYEEVVQAIKSGASGKIVDVTDDQDGERVEIFVE
jgi:SHOCT-like protein